KLKQDGDEYGSTTGRPRRCGWFDAVGLRYAVRINGITAIALTKLDVLTGFKKIPICVAYRSRGKVWRDFPSSYKVMESAEPVWKEMDGWEQPISGARKFSDLPKNARQYVRKLEEILATRVTLISVGPGRDQTILLQNPLKT